MSDNEVIPSFDFGTRNAFLSANPMLKALQGRPLYEGYTDAQLLAPRSAYLEGTSVGALEERFASDPRIKRVAKRRAKNKAARKSRKASR